MSDPYRTAADAGYPRWEYEVRGERSQTTMANDRDVLNANGRKRMGASKRLRYWPTDHLLFQEAEAMSQKKPTAADRPEFRRRALETMKKLEVEVGEIEPSQIIVCTRASEFNPDDNILWELEENRSAVRPDVHCAGCKSEMAMSNHAYAAYASFDKKPRVMCVPCLLELSKTEPIDAFKRSPQGASELNKAKP